MSPIERKCLTSLSIFEKFASPYWVETAQRSTQFPIFLVYFGKFYWFLLLLLSDQCLTSWKTYSVEISDSEEIIQIGIIFLSYSSNKLFFLFSDFFLLLGLIFNFFLKFYSYSVGKHAD